MRSLSRSRGFRIRAGRVRRLESSRQWRGLLWFRCRILRRYQRCVRLCRSVCGFRIGRILLLVLLCLGFGECFQTSLHLFSLLRLALCSGGLRSRRRRSLHRHGCECCFVALRLGIVGRRLPLASERFGCRALDQFEYRLLWWAVLLGSFSGLPCLSASQH